MNQERPTRLGFIGLGLRGQGQALRVARDFADRAQVVALADVAPENLEQAASSFASASPALNDDWRELIARDDLDAVCISTPQFAHRDQTVAAFEAGLHVYCEKPLALSLAECDDMINAGRRAGKVLMVGQQMRYHMHLNRMRRLIDEGRIGTPQMMWLKEFRNPFPATMQWAFDKSRSGGAVVEKSCHHFDVFTWMLGTPPVRVLASGGQAVHQEIFGMTSDVVDHAWVTVEHEDGRSAMLGLCFFAGVPHQREGGVGTHVRDIGVIGQSGMIATEGFGLGRDLELRFSERNEVERILASDPDPAGQLVADGNHGIWVDFFDCMESGAEPVASGAVGRQALAVALAAERAMEIGQPVELG